MAAISSISNGEALSSVRTKLNKVITEINILDPTDWVDYSATSTDVGISSTTRKIIKYRIIGKQMFVFADFAGTSNATTLTFTLPFNLVNPLFLDVPTCNVNNGAIGLGVSRFTSATNYIESFATTALGTFTASGTKALKVQLFFEIA